MSKNIALCFDGTWNTPKNSDGGHLAPTNVYRMYGQLLPPDGPGQVKFYHDGVGTGAEWWDKVTGGINGAGLTDNILEGYRWLARHFSPGDRLFLFGFSRGAFTARSLGGLIRKCGILRPDSVARADEALSLYRIRDGGADLPAAVAFRQQYAWTTDIHFIGVWDTVGALGLPIPAFKGINDELCGFHDTELSGSVRHAYHAVALDEHRRAFEPTLWDDHPKPEQVIEQRWFCGAHANVGGGYQDQKLADVTLQWIRDKAVACGLACAPFAAEAEAYQGVIRNSYREFLGWSYWFTRWFEKPVDRELTLGLGSNETLDPSVLDRLRWPYGHYAPDNLRSHGLATALSQFVGPR